jgi:hypothetical protein
MKIAQSNVNLVSSHNYYEENRVTVQTGVLTRSAFMDSLEGQQKKFDSLELTETAMDDAPVSSETYTSLRPSRNEYLGTVESSLEDQIAELRSQILNTIMMLLQALGGDNQSKGYRHTLSRTADLLNAGSFVRTTTVTATHIEQEATTFSGSGTALTEDGRVIDFGVSFSMSRQLCEYAGISMSSAVSLIDPLVINVGSDVTHISDQTFYFDLDCDGMDDKISNLGSGSGFLALDLNSDGKINDGSELFGAKSGDGFKDLSIYDKDANGWIDENDEVYDLLRIWIRNEDGTDTLMTLKEADVGAINLGSADTQFSQYNSAFSLGGVTRSSGIFLKESGGVGLVQQVDLAAM